MSKKSYKDESLSTKITVIIALAFIIIVAISFIFGIIFFGFLGLFNLLGIHYDSLTSLVVFVIHFSLVGTLGDVATIVFTILIKPFYLNPYAENIAIFVYLFCVNIATISVIDYFMASVSIQINTQIIMALFLSILEIVLDKDHK